MLIRRGRRALATAVVLLTGGLALAALLWFLRPAPSPRSQALFSPERRDAAWPPEAPAELADALATTEAARRIGLSGLMLDAGWRDGGPRPGGLAGLQVRVGTARDLFYIEAVFGQGARFDDPLPMAVLIHGRGDRARIPGGPFWGLDRPLRVIVPQAPDPLGEGFEWIPVRVGENLVDRLTTSLLGRAAELAALLRELRQTLPTVGRPLVVGFSQGGLLTFALATHFPDQVHAAFPLAAWLPPALVPPYAREELPYPPIRGVHGAADGIIPAEPTAALYQTLRERGVDAELVTFEGVGHEMSEAMNEQLHRWLREALAALAPLEPPPCVPAQAGWPEGGWPEAGWPEGGWPEAGWPEGGWPEGGWPEGGWPEGGWPRSGWPAPCVEARDGGARAEPRGAGGPAGPARPSDRLDGGVGADRPGLD